MNRYKDYSIVVGIPGPVIQNMIKKGQPFRIKVIGSNMQPEIEVFINGTKWYKVKWKSQNKI